MGLLAAGSVYWYLHDIEAGYRQREVLGQVVVARESIPARTRITAAMVTVRELPQVYIQSNAAREPTEVVGTVSTAILYAGEQVIKDRVVNEGDKSHGLAYTVAEGKRAITLAVDEVTGVAGFLVPGDRVDVVAHVELPDKRVITRLLLQDLRVLAVGSYLQRSNQTEPVKDMKTITVEVAPQDALPLVAAAEEGKIRLMLRPAVPEGKTDLLPYRFERLGE
ncbi:hypothetical protein SY88_06655 [Clostridiales bacterium PH28_bin88]|nr:hypothetical protein SY88_06655 [Clostridiales bacterium PH28_bin88]